MVKVEYLREKDTFIYMVYYLHCDYVIYHFHNDFCDGSGSGPPWNIISWLVLNQKVEKLKKRIK